MMYATSKMGNISKYVSFYITFQINAFRVLLAKNEYLQIQAVPLVSPKGIVPPLDDRAAHISGFKLIAFSATGNQGFP